MIAYKEEREAQHLKTLDTFHKIFDDKSKWHLHTNKWHRLKSHVAFHHATCIKAELIQLYSNKQPQLLISLSVPSYPSLKELNLKNNRIESIERLRDLDCRQLRVLNLADNHLTQVTRALNKVFLPNLQILILYANNIVEIGGSNRPLAINFHDQADESQEKSGGPGAEWRERGLVELILGVNALTSMRWLNKMGQLGRIKKLSLENNPARENSTVFKHWHIDHQKMLM